MSRRIAYLFATAGCLTFIAPAGADPECFDGVCRMPEVIELPQASAAAPAPADEPGVAGAAPQQASEQPRLGSAPEPVRPQMRVDDLPRPALRPLPQRPVEKEIAVETPQVFEKPRHKTVERPVRKPARHAPHPVIEEPIQQSEPLEVVGRRSAPAEPQRTYAVNPHVVQPSAGVVIVAPGAQYGEDGIAIVNGRQDSSWQLCQVDRPGAGHNRCIQYNYQPYGASGYRPLGSYRAYRSSPSYVYVPDAKVITID